MLATACGGDGRSLQRAGTCSAPLATVPICVEVDVAVDAVETVAGTETLRQAAAGEVCVETGEAYDSETGSLSVELLDCPELLAANGRIGRCQVPERRDQTFIYEGQGIHFDFVASVSVYWDGTGTLEDAQDGARSICLASPLKGTWSAETP